MSHRLHPNRIPTCPLLRHHLLLSDDEPSRSCPNRHSFALPTLHPSFGDEPFGTILHSKTTNRPLHPSRTPALPAPPSFGDDEPPAPPSFEPRLEPPAPPSFGDDTPFRPARTTFIRGRTTGTTLHSPEPDLNRPLHHPLVTTRHSDLPAPPSFGDDEPPRSTRAFAPDLPRSIRLHAPEPPSFRRRRASCSTRTGLADLHRSAGDHELHSGTTRLPLHHLLATNESSAPPEPDLPTTTRSRSVPTLHPSRQNDAPAGSS